MAGARRQQTTEGGPPRQALGAQAPPTPGLRRQPPCLRGEGLGVQLGGRLQRDCQRQVEAAVEGLLHGRVLPIVQLAHNLHKEKKGGAANQACGETVRGCGRHGRHARPPLRQRHSGRAPCAMQWPSLPPPVAAAAAVLGSTACSWPPCQARQAGCKCSSAARRGARAPAAAAPRARGPGRGAPAPAPGSAPERRTWAAPRAATPARRRGRRRR